MVSAARSGMVFFAGMLMVSLATAACAQQPQYPKPTELPNPYRLAEDWPTLPPSMNGGRWGEVIRVHVHSDGNIWIFHRCFNTVPPGSATCIGRGEANPPILQFDPTGKLLKSFGTGMFGYPHCGSVMSMTATPCSACRLAMPQASRLVRKSSSSTRPARS